MRLTVNTHKCSKQDACIKMHTEHHPSHPGPISSVTVRKYSYTRIATYVRVINLLIKLSQEMNENALLKKTRVRL